MVKKVFVIHIFGWIFRRYTRCSLEELYPLITFMLCVSTVYSVMRWKPMMKATSSHHFK
jgi:hypothetical protein